MQAFSCRDGEDPMVTLCRMVTETSYEDLPGEVSGFAKRLILDALGITIAGSSQEAIAEIVDFVKTQGGKPESFIPFYGGKVPASMAAFALGPMTRAIDMGDVHEGASHTSEYIFPALLAATGLSKRITGKAFITAFVVGEEVLIRIGEAAKTFELAALYDIDQGGHFIFGAVAAVGKLIGLSLEELKNAMGIAVSMTQPHDTRMYSPASHMVRVHHAFIAQDAINICLLAKKGITGPHNVLLGQGYLALYERIGTDLDRLTKGLGKDWTMTNTMIKPYAACKCTHTEIYGLIELMEEYKFGPDDIEGIHIDANSMIMRATVEPRKEKWNPRTTPECQFSLPYTVATAAFDKRVFLDSYTDKAKSRKDVRDLMTRITVEENKELPIFASKVTVTLKDSRKLAKEVLYVKGHPKNPFAIEELITKFKWMIPYSTYRLTDAVVDSLIEEVLKLEDVDDMLEIILAITPES